MLLQMMMKFLMIRICHLADLAPVESKQDGPDQVNDSDEAAAIVQPVVTITSKPASIIDEDGTEHGN